MSTISSFFIEPEEDAAGTESARIAEIPADLYEEGSLDSLPGGPNRKIPPGDDESLPPVKTKEPGSDTRETRDQLNPSGSDVIPSPTFLDRFRMLFSKPPEQDITTLAFDPGDLAIPSLEGSLRQGVSDPAVVGGVEQWTVDWSGTRQWQGLVGHVRFRGRSRRQGVPGR